MATRTNARLLQANEQLQAGVELAQQEATEAKTNHKVGGCSSATELEASAREYKLKAYLTKPAKGRRRKWRYGFDNVFTPENGQDDVWDATEPLLPSAVDGFNVTLFAYDQTGSEKSFTMLGDQRNEGVIKHAVH